MNNWILLAILAAIISPIAGVWVVGVAVLVMLINISYRLYERLAYKIYLRGNKNA